MKFEDSADHGPKKCWSNFGSDQEFWIFCRIYRSVTSFQPMLWSNKSTS